VSSGLLSKRNIAILLGALLVLAVVLAAVTSGLGDASVPEDDVAVVDTDVSVPGQIEDGKISKEAFDAALQQAATQQGLPEPPAPGDEQYPALRDQALGQILDAAWILGEAEERDVEVTDKEVQDSFEQTKSESFKTEAEYQKFLEQSGLTQEDVDARVRLQVISEKIQQQISEGAETVSDADAREFYDANAAQFEQPEQRNIRVIVNEDPAQVEQAVAALEQDNSPANWKTVAAQYSTDPSSKDKGGVRESITEGVFEEPLNEEIFDAEQGQVVGPIDTPVSNYAFQVDSIAAGGAQAFDDVAAQVKEQLQGQAEQETFGAFLSDYRDRWVARTVCAEDYLSVRCDNFTGPPSPCPDPALPEAQQQQQLQQGCPPPVQTISPVAPGTILPFAPATSGPPQRPHPAGEDAAATGVPSTIPGGGVVPGAPPTGAPPSTGAPGTGAAPPPPSG
jgi:parvulin-like peptidyl-prolyl isomerase